MCGELSIEKLHLVEKGAFCPLSHMRSKCDYLKKIDVV